MTDLEQTRARVRAFAEANPVVWAIYEDLVGDLHGKGRRNLDPLELWDDAGLELRGHCDVNKLELPDMPPEFAPFYASRAVRMGYAGAFDLSRWPELAAECESDEEKRRAAKQARREAEKAADGQQSFSVDLGSYDKHRRP